MLDSSSSSANVSRFLKQMAEEHPERLAVRAPRSMTGPVGITYDDLSFAQLSSSATAAMVLCRNAGIRRGMRTLLMVKPGLPLIQICFALFQLGAVPVVIDPGMGLRSFLRCVRHTRPEAMVGIPLAVGLSRLFRGSFRGVQTRITVNARWASRLEGLEVGQAGPAETKADELAAILFTSGSTGPAKGVRYTHGMFDAQVRLIRDTYGIQPGEVDLPMLPIFALFNPALGMTTIVPQMNPSRPAKVDPRRIVQAIEQNSVTNSFGSPILWDRIARYCEQAGQELKSLRRVLMAGAPAPVTLLRRMSALMPNGEVHTPYGATECLPVATIAGEEILSLDRGHSTSGLGTCVGRPVSGLSIRILPITESALVSGDLDAPVSTGEIGEIVVTGPSVTREYDHRPEATQLSKVLGADGVVWHRMGDAGYFDEAGRLWFCGRVVERVVTENGPLFTDCIESVYNRLDGVQRSALIGLGKAPMQIPAIVIELQVGNSLSEREILEYGSRFEPTREIRKVFFARAFPVDVRHNAKIHRLALKKRFDRKS